jgi:hypothetical protein
MDLPTTTERVTARTSTKVNQRIAEEAAVRLAWHAENPERIAHRLAELEREWDIERVLEANAASISLIGLALGASVDRRFFALPGIVAGFLLQHALQGWCPPLPLFRRLGVRTQTEIEEERHALKALRGDYAGLPAGHTRRADEGRAAFEAARAGGR